MNFSEKELLNTSLTRAMKLINLYTKYNSNKNNEIRSSPQNEFEGLDL